jgi:hypothetical protein
MQTRNGLTYGEPIHFLQKVEQKQAALDFAEPIHFLQKVEQKTEVLDLAPPFSKVDFDEASTAWKLNKKSTGNGCYKYVCVKVKKMDTSVKIILLKIVNIVNSTFRKGGAKTVITYYLEKGFYDFFSFYLMKWCFIYF